MTKTMQESVRDNVKIFKRQLNQMSAKEIKQLSIDYGFQPEADFDGYAKKQDMIEYIIENMEAE